MTFRQLSLCCVCGRAASRIKQVGLTADHQLVIRWWCPPCKRNVYLVKSLSDCWRDCPKPEDSPEASEPDRRFLHELGVRFPEETL